MAKTLDVQLLDPKKLKPYANNNKVHLRRDVLKLASVIRKVGFDQPIVVDKDMVIIKGHKRTLASVYLQLPVVPVVVRDDLTPEQIMASRIADNVSNSPSNINLEKREQEVAKLSMLDGSLASELFGSLTTYSLMTTTANKDETPQNKNDVAVEKSAPLLSCPKCTHVFVEV